MKYAAYQNYKFSGTEWIGDIPSEWECRRLKDCGALLAGAGFPHEFQGLEDEELSFYKVGDLSQSLDGRHMASGEHTISRATAYTLRAKVIPPSAVVYAKIGAALLLNRRRITVKYCCIDNNMTAFIPYQRKLSTAWAHYWLCTLDFGEFTNPGAIPSLSEGYQSTLPITLPPLEEQQTIVRFLNAKTAQIDALVAQKRQLIAKLKEKRSALIARTVTRGLPPEAAKAAGLEPNLEMKDSRVEWLGAIPAHWATPPLYARYSVELGKMLSEAKITGEHLIPYLRNVDVQWSVINYQDLPEMDIPPAEYPRYTIRSGDLLVCEGGEVGRAAIVGKFGGVIGYQKALHKLRALRDDEDQRFMCFILEWAAQTGVFNAGGMSTIAHLTGEQLRKYRFPKPPKNEQQVIVKYLQRETDKIGHLQREVETAITRLTEYRQALITSAVTGKIDVRGWQAELEAA